MFGNKNSTDSTGQPVKGMAVSNRINHGTELVGELNSDGDIRIEGVVRGTIRCKAKLAIGPSGVVEGDIICKNADVEGKILGDVEVGDTLILKATASIDGNIHTGKMVIENGARFNGVCTMGVKEKKHHVDKALAKALQPEAIS
jgi:cytoskeletal protein CcmA (bactofilin family)